MNFHQLLPEYLRDADGPIGAFLAAAGGELATCVDFLNRADPDTSPSGTCQLTDPDTADRAWLGWLGLVSGIDINTLPEDDVRIDIARESSRWRGTPAEIARRVRRTLSGSGWVRLTQESRWEMTLLTKEVQTADPDLTYAAALLDKPAGIALTHTLVPATEYDDLPGLYPTYDDMAGTTYSELE